jgi:hypothetical protein
VTIRATDTASNADNTGAGNNGLAVYQNINAGAGAGDRTTGLFVLQQNAPLPGTNGGLQFYTGVFG